MRNNLLESKNFVYKYPGGHHHCLSSNIYLVDCSVSIVG